MHSILRLRLFGTWYFVAVYHDIVSYNLLIISVVFL